MDDLERCFARRARRQKFVATIRDAAEPDRSATLRLERSRGTGLGLDIPPHLFLSVVGSGLVDFGDSMGRLGWTKSTPGHSGERGQWYSYRRELPPDERPSTLAAIVRAAAAALLGTPHYLLTIEPFGGISRSEISEAGGYRYLLWIGCFVVAAPILLVATLVTRSSSAELILVLVALGAMAALYPRGIGPIADATVGFELGLAESAVAELPIIGPFIQRAVSLAAALAGLWLPIVAFVAIKWAF